MAAYAFLLFVYFLFFFSDPKPSFSFFFFSFSVFFILFSSKFLQPKHVGNDLWDVAMERRDKKLVESSSAASLN